MIALAGAVSMASKYLLAVRRQHLFNPAAAAALFSGLVFGSFANWWVGGTYLLPLVVMGGALLARKVNRLRLVGVFLAAFLVTMTGLSLINGLGSDMILQSTLFVLGQSAVVFFAVVMLTEPMTSPKRFSLQALYAGLVALLYQPQLSILGHNLTPEQALMAGNVFSYLVSPSYKIRLELKEQRRIGSEIVSFTFARPAWFRHRPGQYMEWSLPLQKTDSRGSPVLQSCQFPYGRKDHDRCAFSRAGAAGSRKRCWRAHQAVCSPPESWRETSRFRTTRGSRWRSSLGASGSRRFAAC